MQIRHGRQAARIAVASVLLTGTLVVTQQALPVSAAEISEIPTFLYVAPDPNNLPGSGLIPYPYMDPVLPEGTLRFVGEDPISGQDRAIRITSTETNCVHTNHDPTVLTYTGCTSVKLDTTGDGVLQVPGSVDGFGIKTHSGGADVDTNGANPADPGTEMYLRGSAAEINAALAALTYEPNDGYYWNGNNPEWITVHLTPGNNQDSVVGENDQRINIRVLDVNDWPEVTAPADESIPAAGSVAFRAGGAPPSPNPNVKYVDDPFFATDEDNDDGTEQDEQDEGQNSQKDGTGSKMLVVMWTTCGSFEVTNTNAFSVGEHVSDLIDDEFSGLDDANRTIIKEAIDAGTGLIPGYNDALLATSTQLNQDRVKGFAALATSLEDLLLSFGEITFHAREPGPSNAGNYLDSTTCELHVVVSDLGNNGLPLVFFEEVSGGHDLVLPWIGVDWDSVEIEIGEAREIDIYFDPADPIFVQEAVSNTQIGAPVKFASDDPHPGFTFRWETVSGTATIGSDFGNPQFGNPAIPVGVTELPQPTIDEPNTSVFGGGGAEGTETFQFRINLTEHAAPPGWKYTSSAPTRTVVILDDQGDPGPAVLVEQAEGQDDPTSTQPVLFDVFFSEEVTGFGVGAVSLAGSTAPGAVVSAVDQVLGSDTAYTVEVSGMTGDGLVVASIPAGAVTSAGDATPNTASFSVDNQVDYILPRTVSINSVSADEGNVGTTPFDFTVSLNAAAYEPVSVNVATGGGTATAGDDYTAHSETLDFAVGEQTKTVTVNVLGDDDYEQDETFFVNLSGETAGLTIADPQGVGTIENDDAPPTRSVSIDDVSSAEGNAGTTDFTFTVSLDDEAIVPVEVDVDTSDVSATAGEDYTAVSTTLQFAVGEQTKSVVVSVNGDTVYEPDETFSVILSNASAGLVLGQAIGTGTIENDDAAPPGPMVSINDVPLAEGDTGITNFEFTLSLSEPAGDDLAVNATLLSGTATAGSDYVAWPNPITVPFAEGTSSATVVVEVIADVVVEPDETFQVILSSPSAGLSIQDNSGLGTILNDDVPAVSIDDVSLAEGDTGTTDFTFTLTLDKPSYQQVQVDVATADDTADGGTDYVVLSQTVTFPPGSTTQTVVVSVNGDTTIEADETFHVNVTNASPSTGLTIADAQAVGEILNDDQPSVVSITGTSVTEGLSGSATVSLANPVRECVVTAASSDGSAIAPGDYTSISNLLLTLNAQTTSLPVPVATAQDILVEGAEAFTITLTLDVAASDEGCELGQPTATVTIIDDDVTPSVLSIGDATVTEGVAGSIPLAMTLPAGRTCVAVLNSTNGTAQAPGDFTAIVNAQHPLAGIGALNVPFTAPNDGDYTESNEQFTVTLTLGAGSDLECLVGDGTATITIVDATEPSADPHAPLSVGVPANIVRPNDPGQAGAVVAYPAATASGGVAPVSVSCSHASGAFYPLGVTTVTCTATDAGGQADVFIEATATASFTITVNDVEPPTIATPPDLTRTTTGNNAVSVTFDLPAASDNSGAPPAVTCTRPTVSTYTVGVATVTCTATDGSGNTASSSFTVTVASPAQPGSGPAAPPTPPGGTLPATGSNTASLATVAAAVMLLGMLLTLSRRRVNRV